MGGDGNGCGSRGNVTPQASTFTFTEGTPSPA